MSPLRRTLFKALLPISLLITTLGTSAQAQVNVMLPANPGGGWDSTGRQAFQAMREAGIYTGGVNFTNTGGAGGTIGLSAFKKAQTGKPDALAVFGAITVGAIVLNKSPLKLSEFRPIARLTAEHVVVAVAANSPYKTVADLANALKANPGAVPVGGGSIGGVDHIALALLAKAAGAPVAKLNYIPQTSGADTVTALVNGTLAAGFSGVGEMLQFAQQGRIRILAVSSHDRKPGLNAPTFRESGYDVEISNWRGILGAPGMPDDSYNQWVDRFAKLNASPAWAQVLKTQNWDQYYAGGEAFGKFIDQDDDRIAAILKETGLAR